MGAIRVTELTKAFRHGPRAVDDVTLEIHDGEFMVLVGRRAAASRRCCA